MIKRQRLKICHASKSLIKIYHFNSHTIEMHMSLSYSFLFLLDRGCNVRF